MDTNTAIALTIDESSQIGEARRIASALALKNGMNENERSNLAIVVNEAANNMLLHANGGKIILQPIDQSGFRCFDIFALDNGRGMRNIGECMRDGFSTAGTAGQGLGAISRLSSAFDIYSAPEQGTVLFSRICGTDQSSPFYDIGVISLPVVGEEVCGDSWSVDMNGPGAARFIVADGLGHGPGAAEASGEAVRVFKGLQGRGYNPAQTLKDIHGALQHTRGAAAAIASIQHSVLTFSGIGNIQAMLGGTSVPRSLTSYNGTVGHQAHKFADFTYPYDEMTFLMMASDGLTTQWKLDKYPGLWSRHPGVIAGLLYRDHVRGRDDATVLVAKRADRQVANSE